MKKTIFSALIVVAAVGGTLVSNASSNKRIVFNAGPVTSPNTSCNKPRPCNPISGQPCTIAGITYGLSNVGTGLCSTPLFLDGTN